MTHRLLSTKATLRTIRATVIAVVLSVGVILSPLQTAFAASPTLSATIDEKVTTGTNKFTYTGGSWTNCGGCNPTAYKNSFKYAYTTGNKAVFTFTGTQAKIYGFREPAGGIASVSVDGGAAVDVNYYASTQSQQNVFSTAVMTSGTHTVSLTVSGRTSGGSSPTITLDKAEVYTGGTPSSDTTAPTITLTAPATGASATIGTTIALVATASDNVGVTKVDFLLDGAVLTSDTTSPYSYNWSTTGVAAGAHTIAAKAYDAAGNTTTSGTAAVTLTNATTDTTAPTVTLTAPTGTSSVTTGTAVTLSATASDNVGVSRVDFLVDGTAINSDATSPYSYSWDTTNATVGTHSITARAYDAAGNNTLSGAAAVTLTAPTQGGTPVLSATVDETVTTGTNKFTYTGSSWTDCGGCNPGAYGNSFKYAYITGDKAVFTFSGTQAKIFGFREPVGGIASVSVDGGAPVDVNYYASTQSQQNVFSTPVLTSGTHTVSFTVSGRMSGGTSATINLDKAEVYTGGSTSASTEVSNLSASATMTSVALSWTAPVPTTGTLQGYTVYQGATKLTATPITTTSYTVNSLTANTAYTFTVKSVIDGIESTGTTVNTTTQVDPNSGFQGRKVAIIGDSLTEQDPVGGVNVPASLVTTGWLSGGEWFYAKGGKMIWVADANGFTTMQNIQQCRSSFGEPDLWIIALGTNDGPGGANIVEGMNMVFAELGPDAHVMWVNLAGANLNDSGFALTNSTIATQSALRPHTYVADWHSYLTTTPQTGLWSSDGIHMTSTGYATRNAFIANQSITAYNSTK